MSHGYALLRERGASGAAGDGDRSAVKPPWAHLPLDCLAHIARHSTHASYASMRLVCKAWRAVPCPFDSVCFVVDPPNPGDAAIQSRAAAASLDTSSGALLPPTLHSLVTLQPCLKTVQLEGVTVKEGELRHLQRVGCVVSLSLAHCLLQVPPLFPLVGDISNHLHFLSLFSGRGAQQTETCVDQPPTTDRTFPLSRQQLITTLTATWFTLSMASWPNSWPVIGEGSIVHSNTGRCDLETGPSNELNWTLSLARQLSSPHLLASHD